MRALVAFLALSASALAQQPSPDQLLAAAMTEQQRGDFDAAIRDYRRVLALRPKSPEAQANLGAALAHQGQYDAAIAEYRAALPAAPQKAPILLNMALAFYKKGDLPHAREQFEAAYKLQPTDVRTAILLGETDLRLNDSAAALPMLEPLAAGNAGNPDFEYVYGSALLQAGKRPEGAAHLEHVGTADALLLAGATLLQLNDFPGARRDLDQALKLDDRLPGVYTLAGTAHDDTGDVKGAEPLFREALRRNPDDGDASLYLGTILSKQRNFEEARLHLTHALALQPKNSMVRYELALLESTSGHPETAVSELEDLVKANPDWLDPHVQLAALYYKLKRPEDGARERATVERLTALQQSKGPQTN